jgi:serine/threonine protein kinase
VRVRCCCVHPYDTCLVAYRRTCVCVRPVCVCVRGAVVQHLHSRGIAHCDLSLENILVIPSTLEIRVIDFGLAVPTDCHGHSAELFARPPLCGKPYYLAPEVCVRACLFFTFACYFTVYLWFSRRARRRTTAST